MSTVFDIVLWSATFILTNFEKYFENFAPYCIILNFVDSNTRKVLTNKSVKTNQISNNLFDKIYQHRHRIRKTGTNVILICFVIQRFYLGGQFMQAFVLDRSTSTCLCASAPSTTAMWPPEEQSSLLSWSEHSWSSPPSPSHALMGISSNVQRRCFQSALTSGRIISSGWPSPCSWPMSPSSWSPCTSAKSL